MLAGASAGSGRPAPTCGPSQLTLWRVLTGIDAAALDAAVGAWLLDQAYPDTGSGRQPGRGNPATAASAAGQGRLASVAIAADGKTCRGAKNAAGEQVHLLAAMTHHQRLVLA